MVLLGKVVSVKDSYDAGRIKVRIKNADLNTLDADLPYAFPFLPKMLHVVPKVGECVGIVCQNDNPRLQRWYIGPFISQNQTMYEDYYNISALSMMNGPGATPYPAVSNISDTYGAFCDDEDIAIYGRKNSDIILSDNDLRIRCGARLTDSNDTNSISFNKRNPSVIKLKYHEQPLSVNKPVWSSGSGGFVQGNESNVESSINVIGQEINLISTEGTPYVKTSNTTSKQNGNETISDEDIKKFIEEAHPLPYGDELLRLLNIFITAFKCHTHKYTQLPPVPDITYNMLDKFDLNSILSKNIRIN